MVGASTTAGASAGAADGMSETAGAFVAASMDAAGAYRVSEAAGAFTVASTGAADGMSAVAEAFTVAADGVPEGFPKGAACSGVSILFLSGMPTGTVPALAASAVRTDSAGGSDAGSFGSAGSGLSVGVPQPEQ